MQTAIDYKYLNLINLTNFDLWDTKRYTSKSIVSSFPIVDLGSCIKEENKKYKLFEEEDEEFGILGVNNKEGIFDAYTQKGKDINQAYKKMEIGWIAYNPYRINVGSIGVRLKEHKNEYISPAYVVFSCLDNLLPEYLYLLFKTERFNKVINESTTGSVRQNLTIDTLKKLQIPLPSLSEQEAIVSAFQSKIQEAQNLERQAQELDEEIERYLYDILEIKKSEKRIKTSTLSFIEFSKVERWAVDSLGKFSKLSFIYEGKYAPIKLRELIVNCQYGLSEKANKEKIGIPMLRMNNINNSELVTDNLKFLKVSSTTDKYLLNKGDLLFNRTNSKELVGKTALFLEDSDYTFASYLIRVVIDEMKANSYFINFLFNSSLLQIQKDLVSRQITGQANINAQEMQEFVFPLPPLDIQNEIAKEIGTIKSTIKNKYSRISNLKQQAEQEFEKAIFN